MKANVLGSAERYRTLLEINNAIITNLTQESLLAAICSAIQRVLPVYRAALTIYDPDTDTIRIHAISTDWNSEYFKVGVVANREDSISGRVLGDQQPFICRDVEANLKRPIDRRVLDEGIQSYCTVPLVLEGKSIGALNIGSDTKGTYSEADGEFLLQIANQVALAVANMKSYEEIAALKTNVERTAERYRTLLEINNAIITNLNQENLLHAIADALRPVIAFDRAAFTLYLPKKDKFRFLAFEGIVPPSHFRAGMEFNCHESVSSWVFEHQLPALRHDLRKEQEYPNDRHLLAEGMNSYCVVPMIVGGQSIGTLNVASQHVNQYSEADAEFLGQLASQVALAVFNMTSFENIAALNFKVEAIADRYRHLLETNNAIITNLTPDALLRSLSDILCRVVPYSGAALTIYDATTQAFSYFAMDGAVPSEYFKAGVAFGRDDTISGWVFDHQRPAVRGDIEKEQRYPNDRRLVAHGIYSDCVVPMMVGGKSIGTLNVGSVQRNQYTDAHIETLQGIANQVALAVRNMMSYQEIAALNGKVERSAERYRTLLEINNAIITNLTQESLLVAICDAIQHVLPVYRAALNIYDPDTDTIRIHALSTQWNSDYFKVGVVMSRTDSHSGWVLDHQRPLICRDIEADMQYPIERRLLEEGIQSYCVVPLILGGKSIGTLNIGSDVKGRYSDAEGDFLQEVASQVAIAVGNMKSYQEIARLKDKEERTAERYRTLLEINNAIITNLTQPALLRAISEALKPVISFGRCAITLYQPENNTFRFLAVEGELLSDYFRAGLELSRDQTCASWVFDHQRPLLRRNLAKERQYANEHRLASEGIQSLCVLPLVFQGKCIGTLSLVSRERDQYSSEDTVLLQEVANQIALAVANMRSYQEIAELKARLEKENVYLQEEIRIDHNFEEITGSSPGLLSVLKKVEQVAATNSTVLILGETGTGKELIARAIHDRSDRKGRPLLKVNCSAISAGLVESELFGHVKGAFTGAFERRIGRFELADGGTIFLDEIGELPLDTQVKLLRVLQEREFEPVGSNRSIRVDVRVVAATNRNLHECIQAGSFRSDLFYRLNVFPIDVPPLRERRSDIPQLAMFFLARFSKQFGKDLQGMSRSTIDKLADYSWPGNVRELQNVIERAVILSRGSVLELDPELIPILTPTGSPVKAESSSEAAQSAIPAQASPATLEEMERAHVIAVLNQTGGIVEGPRGAAKILGLHPNTLRHRIRKLGLKRSAYRES